MKSIFTPIPRNGERLADMLSRRRSRRADKRRPARPERAEMLTIVSETAMLLDTPCYTIFRDDKAA